MSLTEREKEITWECWNKIAELGKGMNPEIFADLFLSRIREEQDAVAYLEPTSKEDDPYAICVTKHMIDDEIEGEWIPLFTTPSAAPCDCSELVETLELIRKGDDSPRTLAMVALANHAKRMKGEE